MTSHKIVFHTKYSIKGQQRKLPSYPPLSCDLHTGSGIGASCWFHQSHLPPMLLQSLRHRGCLSDITGALSCSPGTLCGWFLVSPPFVCCFNRLFACFCHKMTVYQLGGYDHSVLYTSAQQTEGRSARDQPKQPPAKKKGTLLFWSPCFDSSSFISRLFCFHESNLLLLCVGVPDSWRVLMTQIPQRSWKTCWVIMGWIPPPFQALCRKDGPFPPLRCQRPH